MSIKISIFEANDKAFFEDSLDKIAKLGEFIGLKINKNSKIVIRSVALFLALLTFGIALFLGSLVKNSFNKKK
jgi:hypothetical protein